MADPREHWTIDKKIPIALLSALLVQAGCWIWQASAAAARLDQVERQLAAMNGQAERIVRLETKSDLTIQALAEVKDILRQRH